MVCDAYHPQIQAILCNYAAAARELNISEAAGDSLENCECRGALWKPDDACFSKDGHLLTIDTRKLRWPYLRKIVERGKKFRLESDMDTVFAELRHSLDCYVTWSARGDEERLEKLEDWADAVYKRCKANWERKVQESPSHLRGPKGYPGLRRTIQEAHKSLVFLLDDRAPHGLVVVCKRWYQKEMAKYLLDNSVFQDTELSWTDVMQLAADFNSKWGFPTEKGIVYNYGIWKPKKQRFRFIAGTRAMARDEGGDSRRSTGPPRQPLFKAHKALVGLLQQVEKALKEKDKLRQREEGIRAFWGIDSINTFTMLVHTHEDIVLREGQFTADFCTMYTSFPLDLMIERTIMAGTVRDTPVPGLQVVGLPYSAQLHLQWRPYQASN